MGNEAWTLWEIDGINSGRVVYEATIKSSIWDFIDDVFVGLFSEHHLTSRS
jgi:hypothetical protein